MIDAKEYLEAGLKLHGHKCPAIRPGLAGRVFDISTLPAGVGGNEEQ